MWVQMLTHSPRKHTVLFYSLRVAKVLRMKTQNIKIRLTATEKLAIMQKAKSTGLSTSAYMRKCALEKRIDRKMSDEELAAFSELKKVYNSFQSIANSWRTGESASKEISEALQVLKIYLTEIQNR